MRVEERNARGTVTKRYLDALGREVKRVDALGQVAEARFDARNLREAKDRKGYVTEYDYDAV